MSNPPRVLAFLFPLAQFRSGHSALPDYLSVDLNVSLSLVPTDWYLGLSVLNH